jgi:hypothetical protein
MVLLFTVFVERKKFFSVGFFFFEIGSGAYPLEPARGGGWKLVRLIVCLLDLGPNPNLGPGVIFTTSAWPGPYSSSAPNTFPVLGLTMWACLQAKQVTD